MYAQAIVAASLAAASALAGWTAQGWRLGEQIAELKREQAVAAHKQLEKAHAETIRLQSIKDSAEKLAQARQSALSRAAAAVRVERDGLRDELAASRVQLPDASCTSVRQHAATLSDVFGECAAEIEGLAGPASGHASDSLKLQQSWPK
jgi:ABC-type phosphate transport system auxiliary subunit